MNLIETLYEKKFITCDKHGQTAALFNGNCEKCTRDHLQAIENAEFEKELIVKKIDAGIPSKFLNCTFDNYRIETKEQNQNVATLKAFRGDCNVLMMGSVGNGKTHLAAAVSDKLLRMRVSCVYMKFYQIMKIAVTNPTLYNKLLTCGFLIVDEYGMSATDNKNSGMFEIIDQRYDNEKYTMIVSNATPKELKSVMSDAALSRLKEKYIGITCNGEDFRQKSK